jgi:hypothetical protein
VAAALEVRLEQRSMKKRIYLSAVVSVALMTIAACAGSGNTTTPATPTPNASVAAVTVTSAASSSTTFQLSAMARMADGTVRDVTSSSIWASSNAGLASVSSSGLLTVFGSGEVEVRATYQSVLGTLRMIVTQPPQQAKYTVSGVAREAAPTAMILVGLRIEFTSGPDAGTVVMSDSNGFFSVALTPGLIAMQATKDGYEIWRVANLTMDQSRAFDITMYLNPPRNAAGSIATARCADGSWSWALTRARACTESGGVAYGQCPGPICE